MKKQTILWTIILSAIIFCSQNIKISAQSTQDNTTVQQTIKDVEGNIYNTVKIGNQVWMKENLKTKKYRNGDPIPTTVPATKDISPEETIDPLAGKDYSTSSAPKTEQSVNPGYQWTYNGDESNASFYGRLYTWYVVADKRGVCPDGWRVPSDNDWNLLFEFLGGNPGSGERGNANAGGKMKETGTDHWEAPNSGAINKGGFTALPGGGRNIDGTFSGKGIYGAWWATSPSSYRHIEYDDPYVYRNYYYSSRIFGFSIRCIKD